MSDSLRYQELKGFDFDAGYIPDEGKSFEDKLAQANNWTPEYTQKVIEEYKKFMFLVITHGGAAPSDPIDQVWHQHILYTKDYHEFCMHFAGRFLHHSPDRFKGASSTIYADTLENYEDHFGKPNDIWALKATDYRRVDLGSHYMIPADSLASAIKLLFLILKNKVKWY